MDVGGLLGGLSNVMGMLDPESLLINVVGGQLGMDAHAKNLARVIAGALTLQPQTVLGGALGLLGEEFSHSAASTEYPPPPPGAPAPQGYACPPPGVPSNAPPATPPPGFPAAPPQGAGSPLKSILNDPTLSLEEKIARVLDAVMGDLDKSILETSDKLGKADGTDRDKLMRDLQRLMEQRRQMNDLASNALAAFNGMCMTAIQNMRA